MINRNGKCVIILFPMQVVPILFHNLESAGGQWSEFNYAAMEVA